MSTYFIGCPHFGHEAMYRFTRSNGEKVRPYASAEEGDTVIRENWNRTVSKGDKEHCSCQMKELLVAYFL